MPSEQDFLTYKGHPLVRSGDTIYYGSTADKYIVMMKILSENKVNNLSVADKVQVSLMNTDPDIRAKDKVIKKSERNGLYNAMDLGAVWLERALDNK